MVAASKVTFSLFGWCQGKDKHHDKCRIGFTAPDGSKHFCSCPQHDEEALDDTRRGS